MTARFFTLTQHNANQARAKMIATKYAKNATGAVTGVSRTCFSLGQATGPLVSGLIWNWSVSGPYLLLAAVHLSQILVMVVTRAVSKSSPILWYSTVYGRPERGLNADVWNTPHPGANCACDRTFEPGHQ